MVKEGPYILTLGPWTLQDFRPTVSHVHVLLGVTLTTQTVW